MLRIAAVFLGSALLLSWDLNQRGVGSGTIDRVGQIRAQDESVYAHTSLRMAQTGDWLSPRFMDRLALYKPPLSYWLSAISIKLFGASPLSLRLGVVLAGAGTVALVFAWGGPVAAILLLSSALFHTLARTAIMDAYIALATLLTGFILVRGRDAGWIGLVAGLAILTKGPAGTLPLLMYLLWCALERRWPSVKAFAIAALAAAPWFIYQLLANGEWFWREFVLTEMLHWGLGSPLQTSADSLGGFYLRRFFLLDPLLALLALPALWIALSKALWAGVIVTILATALYGYRNIAYLLPALPLCAVAVGQSAGGRPWAVILVAIVTVAKLAWPALPGSLQVGPATIPSASVYRQYCQQRPGRELILIDPDDDFYAALLPLGRLRYGFFEAGQVAERPPLDLREYGILTTVDQYLSDRPKPPGATAILFRTSADVAKLIDGAADADFVVPAHFVPASAPHIRQPAANGRLLLLSRERNDSPVPDLRPSPGLCEWPR